MGLATCLLFKNFPVNMSALQSLSNFFINLTVFLYIPLVLVTFAGGVASLKKDVMGGKCARNIIGWAFLSTVVLSLCSVLVFYFFPLPFPVSSTAGSDVSAFASSISQTEAFSASQLVPINPFTTLNNVTLFILPVVIIAWILGLALKPSTDVIRPAYTVVNSFSEVMYRISRTATAFSSVLVYLFSTQFFLKLYQDKTLFVAPKFFLVFIVSELAVILVVLPLLFGLLTLFKKNPYNILFRSFAPILMALTSSNYLSSSLLETSVSRQNIGVQKRITSVTVPVSVLIARGGTAFVSALSVMMILTAIGANLTLKELFLIAGCAALLSLLSSLFTGSEAMVITYLVISFMKINTGSAIMTMLAVLPFVNGLGLVLDSYISELGAAIVARKIGTDIMVPYRDTI